MQTDPYLAGVETRIAELRAGVKSATNMANALFVPGGVSVQTALAAKAYRELAEKRAAELAPLEALTLDEWRVLTGLSLVEDWTVSLDDGRWIACLSVDPTVPEWRIVGPAPYVVECTQGWYEQRCDGVEGMELRDVVAACELAIEAFDAVMK